MGTVIIDRDLKCIFIFYIFVITPTQIKLSYEWMLWINQFSNCHMLGEYFSSSDTKIIVPSYGLT